MPGEREHAKTASFTDWKIYIQRNPPEVGSETYNFTVLKNSELPPPRIETIQEATQLYDFPPGKSLRYQTGIRIRLHRDPQPPPPTAWEHLLRADIG